MQWTKTGAVALALCSLLLATVVFAAQPKTDMYRASKLIGADVENPSGQSLGDIKDIVLDPQTGQIAYAVLGFGGFLGMGEKYFAIPWAALSAKEKRPGEIDKFVLNVDQEKLKNAPGFDKNNWPNMADRSWGQQVYAYYGVQPYWEHREAMRQESATTLAATVQNVDQSSKLLRIRTANDEVVEFQAPAGLLSRLQDGDRIEVVIHKQQEKVAPPAAAQPSSPPAPSGQPAR
jgi:sporulation protein YlmC with PRC-barrel domain